MLPYILLAASLTLGLATGNGLPGTGRFFIDGLTAWGTLQLLGVVALIEMIAVLLEQTGGMQRALAALRRVIHDPKVLIAAVPTALGSIPVPGGAMLSAPMVGVYGDEIGFNAEEKASVNLFFRHVWDVISPFKPQMILTAAVVNVPLFALIGWQLPISLATLFVGYWWLVGRRPRRKAVQQAAEAEMEPGKPLWVDVGPLAIPLIVALAFGIDFVFAVAIGLLFGLATQKVSRAMLVKMVREGIHLKLLLTLASVMVFKTVIERTEVMKEIAGDLTGYGIPLEVLAIALPLATGYAIGMEMAAVGIVFPLVIALLPEGVAMLPYAIVMLVANAVGSTLSPVHTCMVVGNGYYGARWTSVARMNLPPFAFRMGLGLLVAWGVASFLP